MTITEEWSIAEDSTLSASPLPLRRAQRTYGRSKEASSPLDQSITSPAFPSPAFPHPINTPNSRSSTPPTSDINEEPFTKKPPKKKRTSWKGKAKDIPAEDVSDSMASDSGEPVVSRKLKTRLRKNSKVKVCDICREGPVIHIFNAVNKQKRGLHENARERSRAAAIQYVPIPRTEEHKYTLKSLFQSLKPPATPSSSDPIQQFTSSSPITDTEAKMDVPQAVTTLQRQHSDLPPLSMNSDSDMDLPEVGELLKEQGQKRTEASRVKELSEAKRWALMKQAQQKELGLTDGSDDDLEIVDDMKLVAEEEMDQRRAIKARHSRPSEGRKRQMMLARVNIAHGHRSPPVRKLRDPMEDLKVMVQPSFDTSRNQHGKGSNMKDTLTRNDLNRILMKRIDEEKSKITQTKETEWVKRGGKLNEQWYRGGGPSKGPEDTWKAYVEKGLKVIEDKPKSEDESDEDWTPETNDSPSPSRNGSDEDVSNKDRNDAVNSEEEILPLDGADDVNENDLERPRAPRRTVTRTRAVQDSDEDDELENKSASHSLAVRQVLAPDTPFPESCMPPPQQMPRIIHRPSFSSFEEPTEDEMDKENNTRLMYDKSEDKENKAVVRHSPGGRNVAHGGSFSRSASMKGLKKPFSATPAAPLSDDDNEVIGERTPFKDLLDDPFASPVLPDEVPFATRLQQASRPSLTPQPVILGTTGSGFSQFLDENENEQNTPCLLETAKLGGHSQSFNFGTEPTTPPSVQPNGSDPVIDTKCSLFNDLRKHDNIEDLSLTLDVRLQPALEVSENFRRQADTIFEKEQVYLIEAARKNPVHKETLYVNDHGFLTQTRPDDVSSPEIYRITSPVTPQISGPFPLHNAVSASQSGKRHPLRTLSFSQEFLTPGNTSNSSSPAPLGRLRRRSMSPLLEQTGYRSSPSKKLNAFEVLVRGQAKIEKRTKERERLNKSDFLEIEAQESDEDDKFGFGGLKKMTEAGEDEDDGDHLDKHLEGLVDDKPMDAESQALDLVLEKVKEHQEEDDLTLEKYHRDAVEGKLRVKRRNRGLDMDDSDEEEDDDERASRIRRQMHKKRKIGEDIEALGKNEETRAFYDAYQRDLVDDPMDFGRLEEDEGPADEEETQETVSRAEIRERVREMARAEETHVPPNDVSWLDDSEDEGHADILVKEVVLIKKPTALPRTTLGQVDLDVGHLERKQAVETEPERVRLTSWAKAENRSRKLGMARSAAGSSVTGHGKAKVRAGAGSVRTGPQGIRTPSSATHVGDGQRKLSKTSSVLAGIADRTRRFEQC